MTSPSERLKVSLVDLDGKPVPDWVRERLEQAGIEFNFYDCGTREELAEHLRPDTPLFTKQLAPGLGFAEDPGDGGSFGMHRCRLLAEAIWREPSIDGIIGAFESNGISIDQPYLNTGSIDQYELR